MRSPVLLSLLLTFAVASPAEARLFWQTYGSVVPTADGGCTWNANQDYFVPRTCTTGRYGLFSPCKTSCTVSPACRRGHALYPGYCSCYGALHYLGRNCVYRHHCGCGPIRPYHGPYREGCGPQCQVPYCAAGIDFVSGAGCGSLAFSAVCSEPCFDGMYLPNVESREYQVLGSLSVAGDPLLTSLQVAQPAGLPSNLLNPSATPLEQLLPKLGLPEGIQLPSLPSPN